ncbi:MAG: Dyp-type peroxidase [Cyanobacteriota bacterium]
MALKLDLADIQGNVLIAYGRLGFPKARCVLLHINKGQAAGARDFLEELRGKITTAELWPSSKTTQLPKEAITAQRPDVAINVAFTFSGLLALGVPVRTLRGLPDEFQQGMLQRAEILRDDPLGHRRPESRWDPIWLNELEHPDAEVHVLVTFNAAANPSNYASSEAALDAAFEWLQKRSGEDQPVKILPGHRGPNPLYQDMGALVEPDPNGPPESVRYSRTEHFGFADGFGDPVFEGQYPEEVVKQRVIGQGKLTAEQTWVPLATGEFLLGYPDEAQELPASAVPLDFSRNGTFIAYRKLHQNVKSFSDYIAATATQYGAINDLDQQQAEETLKAKMAGRWTDGVPVVIAPNYAEWQAFRARLAKAQADKNQPELDRLNRSFTDFTYADDADGSKCPFSSHLRRSNPRDMLDPTVHGGASTQKPVKATSVLNNRHRLLRRGLPYGSTVPIHSDEAEQGVLVLFVCASLFRQFEFIQQQWIEYGLDFNAGNDTCPIIGNHGEEAKFVVATSAESGKPPFICDRPPQFVETRGGAYFFVPSMTCLRLIAQGLIDPT